ncbi:unnamed protein product [Pylaiella littoralis]
MSLPTLKILQSLGFNMIFIFRGYYLDALVRNCDHATSRGDVGVLEA